jgi:hypothetical protein
MTGICWRLLAVCSLILIAPTFLRGQDADADPVPTLAPMLRPILSPLRFSPPIAPVWIPPPRLPEPYRVGRDPVGRYPLAPGTVIFQQLVRAAGIIFSGRVTSIGLAPSSLGHAEASTNVTFQVERALRGTSPGRSLTIHEWAGLWRSGERYRVGERVLLFLYSPSKLGLTSPVAGALGRFALDSEGSIVLSARHVAALADDPVLFGKRASKSVGKTGGKTVVPYADFIQAVRRSGGEE